MEKGAMRRNTKTNKKPIIIIGSIVLVLCLAVTAYLVFFRGSKTELTIASKTDIIEYFDTNGITEYFNEALNINIKWVDYGTENVYERVKEDASKNADELPDAYLGIALYENEMKAIAPDVFLDITNIVDSETVEFKSAIAEDTDRLSKIKTDGKIYSFPTLHQEYSSEYPQKVWINSDWLDKINAEMPKTTEELYNILVKFKDNDLNGNGEADEIPLGVAYTGGNNATFGFIVNSFITSDYDLSDTQGYLNVDNNGNVYSAVTDDKYKDALAYIKTLFDEGLVSENTFTQDVSVLLEGNKNEEKYGVIAAQDINAVFNDTERSKIYTPIAPLNGGNTATLVKRTAVQTGGFMVGRETKNLDLVIQLGDKMLSQDGTLTILYGKEGSGWNKADGRIASMGGTETTWKIADDNQLDNSVVRNAVPYWYSAALQMSQQAAVGADGNVDLQTTENWQGYLNKITREKYQSVGQSVLKNLYPEIVLTEEQEAELTKDGKNIRTDVYDYMMESARQFVLGEKSLDDDWDTYVDTINSKGLEKIIEFSQKAYDNARN